MYTLKPGKGSLFKNQKKATETHPDYTGSIKLPNGTEHWISMWVNDGKNGKYFSVSIGKPKEPKKESPPDFDDDWPL